VAGNVNSFQAAVNKRFFLTLTSSLTSFDEF
jgi:hypothetical protein